MLYVTKLDESCELVASQSSLGEGAEGRVLRITSPSEFADTHVFKQFKEQIAPASEAGRKVLALCSDTIQSLRTAGLIWPEYVVWDDCTSLIAGFLMRNGLDRGPNSLSSSNWVMDLETFLKKKYQKSPKAELPILLICERLTTLVSLVHAFRKIVISDLKPQNILIDSQYNLSLIDLDSIQLRTDEAILRANSVTPAYLPPEYWEDATEDSYKKKPLALSLDEFSLAVILYRLIFGIHPYSGAAFQDQKAHSLKGRIINGYFPFGIHQQNCVEFGLHRDFRRCHYLLKELFQRAFSSGQSSPGERPTAEEWAAFFHDLNQGMLGLGVVPFLRYQQGCIRPAHWLFSLRKSETYFPPHTTIVREKQPNGLHTQIHWEIPIGCSISIVEKTTRKRIVESAATDGTTEKFPRTPKILIVTITEISSNRRGRFSLRIGARAKIYRPIQVLHGLRQLQPVLEDAMIQVGIIKRPLVLHPEIKLNHPVLPFETTETQLSQPSRGIEQPLLSINTHLKLNPTIQFKNSK
jgi:Protein kinase domain